jgi:formylglycine-generating enzyme required for sulfatase activity
MILIGCSAGPAPAAGEVAQDKMTPAFPGAEGFGMYTQGGRGGKVFVVTTLEDCDVSKGGKPMPGSLRAAIEADEPRIIVFRVGGTIELKRSLQINHPHLTIAGQTAPGGGICLKGDAVYIANGHDMILRYLRIRPGDLRKGEIDGFCIFGGSDIILDHCSVSWSIDECLSTQQAENTTIQWTMIALPLNRSFHPKGAHGLGSLIDGPSNISFHHDIYAHSVTRNPRPADNVLLDFRNNVIYDWGDKCGYNAGDPVRMNYVGNYLKPGPCTEPNARRLAFHFSGPAKAYVAGNVMEGYDEVKADNWLMMWYPGGLRGQALRQKVGLDNPLPILPVTTTSAEVAYQQVLEGCGATLPKRDRIDELVVEQIRTGTGKIIDSQDDVGGWPELEAGVAPVDSDSDGIPDEWEKSRGLNPNDPSDSSQLSKDGSGYANIEVYINSLIPAPAGGWPTPPAVNVAEVLSQAKQVMAEARRMREDRGNTIIQRTVELSNLLRPAPGRPLSPEEAAKLPKTRSFDLGNGVTMELVLIPAGTFMMGSPPNELDRDEDETQHQVTITRPYYIGATEVTQAQYAAVTGEKLRSAGSAQFPAQANWVEAGEFCLKLSDQTGKRFRPPAEVEWEYACRAGTATPFSTGETIGTDQAAYDGKYVYGKGKPGVTRAGFAPVKSYPPNPWGLYDMHGNAWEWCYDSWSSKYPPGPATDPIGPPEEDPKTHKTIQQHMKVLRGGSSIAHPEYLRSACRYRYVTKNPFGFRVVMEVE